MAVLILASAAVVVNAESVTMVDFGVGSGRQNDSIHYVGAGDSLTYPDKCVTYWALDWFEPDYTYTFTWTVTLSPNPKSIGTLYATRTTSRPSEYTNSSFGESLTGALKKVTYDADTDRYIFTVKYNPSLESSSPSKPLYVILRWSAIGVTTLSSNGWGWSCEYDPGGSKLTDEILSDIRDQLHAGDDYTPPTSAATDLNNSLTSLDSAEASLSSKADELRTAGSATMSSAISAAQDLPNKIGASTTFLATTFTRFWEAVPEEVTAVLLVCAAILFAGWLIGRIQ